MWFYNGLGLGWAEMLNTLETCSGGARWACLSCNIYKELNTRDSYMPRVATALTASIFHHPFKRQLKKLVLEPLQQLSLQGVIYPTVVIIDGLDECLNHDERTILLRAISIATAQYPAPLKFLITSRPDVLIARIFNATPVKEASILHSLNIPVMKARLDCSISGHAALRQKVMLICVIGRSCLFWYYHFPVKFIMKDYISHLLIVACATNFSFSFQSASSDDEPRAERITNTSNYIPSKYLIVNET